MHPGVVKMADIAQGGDAAGDGSGGAKGKLVSGGVGIVLGSASTLLTTQVANLGVRQLLNDNSYVGLAVFSLLTALVVFVIGMVLRKPHQALTPVILPSAALVVAAIIFAGFSTLPAQRLPVVLHVEPAMGDAPPIKVVGVSPDDLAWEHDMNYAAERQHSINLNAQPVKDYYANQLAHCVQTLSDAASGKVTVALNKDAY
jgi:hypothetical protein